MPCSLLSKVVARMRRLGRGSSRSSQSLWGRWEMIAVIGGTRGGRLEGLEESEVAIVDAGSDLLVRDDPDAHARPVQRGYGGPRPDSVAAPVVKRCNPNDRSGQPPRLFVHYAVSPVPARAGSV